MITIRTNLNLTFRASIIGMIMHVCFGCGCLALVHGYQESDTNLLSYKEEGYLVLQAALAKERELNYMAETVVKRRGARMPIVMIEYVVNTNGTRYRRIEYRIQEGESGPIGVISITNQHGNWHYTEKGIIKEWGDYSADTLFLCETI